MLGNYGVSAYFIQPGSGLRFTAVTPCRLVDTRTGNGGGGPIPGGTYADLQSSAVGAKQGLRRSFCGSFVFSECHAGAAGPSPGFLSHHLARGSGAAAHLHHELARRSREGECRHRSRGVDAGVSVYVTNTTDVVIDIDGFFAPAAQVDAAVLSADAVPRGRHPQRQLPAGPGHAALVGRSRRATSPCSMQLPATFRRARRRIR